MYKTSLPILLFFIAVFHAVAQDNSKVELVNENLNRFLNVRDFCISADRDEMYFTVQSPSQKISQIAMMKKVNGKWSEPELMFFSEAYADMEPFLSTDQLRLYFVSNRIAHPNSVAKQNFDIWYIERKSKSAAWSQPVNMGLPVNTEGDEFFPSLAANGNLYFTSERNGGPGKDDIYFCRFENGKFAEPVALDSAINSEGMEFNAFISSDDKYLIYTKYNSPGGNGSGDLYIAKKTKNNTWQPARNLGTVINTKYMEYCPYYDTTTKTLYFTSRRENLQERNFSTLEEFNNYVSGAFNGLSKLYKVHFDILQY